VIHRFNGMSRLTRNIAYNLLGQAALLLLGLIAVRLIFRRLGPEVFALILFAQTVGIVLTAVLDLGISSITVREVAAHAEDDPAYVRDLLRTAASLYWGAYVVLLLAVVVGAPLLVTKWLNPGSMSPESASRLIQMLCAGSLLVLPRVLYGSLCRGLQRMVFNNVVEVGGIAIQQLGIVAILAAGGDVMAVAAWFSASYALTVIAYLLIGSRLTSWRSMMPGFKTAVIARNWRFAMHMASVGFFGIAVMQVDKLTVSKLLPLATLGPYSFASTVVSGGSRVTYAIAQAAFPAFAEMHSGRRTGDLSAQARKVHDLVTFVTAPLFALVTFASLPLFTYVFSGDVAHGLVAPVALLCVGSYLNATLSVPYFVSIAVGRPAIAARQNILGLAIVAPIAFLATARFGLTGAAMGWVVYHLVAYVYGLPRMCREGMGVSTRSWLSRQAGPMALLAGCYGLAFLLGFGIGGGSTGALLASYLLATIVYVVAGFRLLGSEIKDALWARLRAPILAEAA